MSLADALVRSAIFAALAALTGLVAYLYQRNERTQRVSRAWIWPAFYTVLALHAALVQLPQDQALRPWLAAAFSAGVAIGVARGFALRVTIEVPRRTMHVMATPLSAALYIAVLFYNEFLHVFRYGDPRMARISCALLVLTAGNSIAVNAVRVLRYASVSRRV